MLLLHGITAVDSHWRWQEPRRRLPRGCSKRLAHGVEGRYGGRLVQLHNNIQELTACDRSSFSPALTGEALKNAEHWNWLPTVSVDNSLEEGLFNLGGQKSLLCFFYGIALRHINSFLFSFFLFFHNTPAWIGLNLFEGEKNEKERKK